MASMQDINSQPTPQQSDSVQPTETVVSPATALQSTHPLVGNTQPPAPVPESQSTNASGLPPATSNDSSTNVSETVITEEKSTTPDTSPTSNKSQSNLGLSQQSLVTSSSTSGFVLPTNPVFDEISAVTTLESLRDTITNGQANHTLEIKSVAEEVRSSRTAHSQEFHVLQQQINENTQSLKKTLKEEMASTLKEAMGDFMLDMMKKLGDKFPGGNSGVSSIELCN
jgi:hypothetical protein